MIRSRLNPIARHPTLGSASISRTGFVQGQANLGLKQACAQRFEGLTKKQQGGVPQRQTALHRPECRPQAAQLSAAVRLMQRSGAVNALDSCV